MALIEQHTPDRGQIPDTTDPEFVRSVRVIGEGKTDLSTRSLRNKNVSEFLTLPYINLIIGETEQSSVNNSINLLPIKGAQLWENWHRNFHEIPPHMVAYVLGIRLGGGSEWWKVRH
ncbi:hypothetical protein Dimus_003010, partial [Dionaea muscipula]